MKKIFFGMVLFFACITSASAQDTKLKDPNVLAKNELNSLMKVIEIDNNLAITINSLLLYKHETVLKSPERKEEIAITIDDKLKGIFLPEQYAKIKKNKVLYNDLLY
ncbi:hypothetical protein [Flavobacterium sp.]|jgi:hypothetical protein|uniref:hypothetical protein n=1 Tax=Flavobacterium sp. TaxID=239 RepID=UPI0037C02068